MAEFNRTALDMMDELYAPYKESAAQGRQLQRSAAGLELQRRTQVADTEAKWGHEKAGTMAKWVQDAEVAKQLQADRQSNITLVAEEQQRVEDEAKEATRLRILEEDREDVMNLFNAQYDKDRILKVGHLDTGITADQIAKGKSKSLHRFHTLLKEQAGVARDRMKDRNTLVNEIAGMMRTSDGAKIVDNILDGETLVNLRSDDYTREDLAVILHEIVTVNTVAENKPILETVKNLKQERDRLYTEKDEKTGESLQDILMDNNEPAWDSAAIALGRDPTLEGRLESEGGLDADEARRVMAFLKEGRGDDFNAINQAMRAAGDEEGQQVLHDALKAWLEKEKHKKAASIWQRREGRSFNLDKIERIDATLKQLHTDYKWLSSIPTSYYYDDKHLSEITDTPAGESPPVTDLTLDEADAAGTESAQTAVNLPAVNRVALEGGIDPRHSVAMEVLGKERAGGLSPDEAITTAANDLQKEIGVIKKELSDIGATRVGDEITISKHETKSLRKVDYPISGYRMALTPAKRAEAKAIDEYNESLKKGVDAGGNLFTRDKSFDVFTKQSQVAKTKYDRLDELLEQLSALE